MIIKITFVWNKDIDIRVPSNDKTYFYISYLSDLTAMSRMWHKVNFLNLSTIGFNSEFCLSLTSCYTKIKEISMPYQSSITWMKNSCVLDFLKSIVKWKQSRPGFELGWLGRNPLEKGIIKSILFSAMNKIVRLSSSALVEQPVSKKEGSKC